MQRAAPIEAGHDETEAAPAQPVVRDMIPLTQSKMHGPAPEQPVLPRRSALVIEILSFILIAFLVVSALLFNLAAPSNLISSPPSVSIQLPPMPTEPPAPPTATAADVAPQDDHPAAVTAATAASATEPTKPPPAAAVLPDLQPQAGQDEQPQTEPPIAEIATLPPAAAPVAAGATSEESSQTAPAPATAEETASLPLPVEATEALIRRGNELLGTGDIVAARFAYERAAAGGSRAAATGVAKTYDPVFLAQTGVRGLRGDPARAALWYGKAAAAGDREAQQRLRRLRAQFPQ